MAEAQEEERNGNGRPSCSSINPSHHFFRIMLSPKLTLPEDFVKEFRDDVGCVAKLRDPNEHVWEVGVEKCVEGVWFGDNWKEYLEYYSISHGYLIVFKYEGNSCFRVLIFDTSAGEITYPIPSPTVHHFSINNINMSDNRKRELVDDELAIVTSCHQSNNNMDHIDDQVKERDTIGSRKATKTRKKKMYRWLRRAVTEEERMAAIQRAETFRSRSENPSFSVLLRPHHTQNPHVYVEMPFCSKYMSGLPGSVSLEVADGRHWRVSYTYNHKEKSGKSLRKGWAAFYRENLLEEGDLCVFELINPLPDLVLKVEIFRVLPLNGGGVPLDSESDRIDL